MTACCCAPFRSRFKQKQRSPSVSGQSRAMKDPSTFIMVSSILRMWFRYTTESSQSSVADMPGIRDSGKQIITISELNTSVPLHHCPCNVGGKTVCFDKPCLISHVEVELAFWHCPTYMRLDMKRVGVSMIWHRQAKSNWILKTGS